MPPAPAGLTVLVVDDSAIVRAIVCAQLEAADYAVREAVDGPGALETARAGGVDVVLLDVEMPGLDGHQVLAALKADPRTSDLPVVFLTGRSGSEDLVQAMRDGAHDYLRKPTDPAELLARVGAAARLKVLQDQLRQRAEELDRIGRTDALTGLHNRRHAEEQLSALLSSGRRHGYAVTALLVDIDRFKAVNDTVGHAGGDAVLREVATRLAVTVRREDLVGRWGGEEFLVLAPHTATPAAAALAERLRVAVGERPVDVDDRQLPVTISVGGAVAPSGAGAPEQLLQTADRNLYAAKEAGRDRVLVSELADRPGPPVV